MFDWLKRFFNWIFGDDDKPEPEKPQPIPVPIDPHEPPPSEPIVEEPVPPPPGPDPAPGPAPPPPPITPGFKPDRLWIDGEELDSHVIDHPGDPAQGIPPGTQVVKTVLTPIRTRKGGEGTLRIKLLVQPLENEADRKKLKDALRRPGAHTLFLGSHQLHVVTWPIGSSPVLMSAPRIVHKVGDIQVHAETSSANYRYLKLYFYGDTPMEIENDLRRRAYPMRGAPLARRPPRKVARRSKYWYAGWRGDQGSTSQCVAYGSLTLYHASPFTYPAPRPRLDPAWLYGEAQKVDPWPGEEPEYDGTSSDAAFGVMKREGLIESYWWATSFDEAVACLIARSPVCFGTPWRQGMDEPDAQGRIRAIGPDRGGHLYCAIGGNLDMKLPWATRPGAARILNSWGDGWADGGRAWVSLEDLESLFDDGGEAVLVVER
ncbi:MAG: hypothetical protein LC798_13715 [Chloroflexi bacterium]|nr:hypothetical protein [Chloroflexota bacterium]